MRRQIRRRPSVLGDALVVCVVQQLRPPIRRPIERPTRRPTTLAPADALARRHPKRRPRPQTSRPTRRRPSVLTVLAGDRAPKALGQVSNRASCHIFGVQHHEQASPTSNRQGLGGDRDCRRYGHGRSVPSEHVQGDIAVPLGHDRPGRTGHGRAAWCAGRQARSHEVVADDPTDPAREPAERRRDEPSRRCGGKSGGNSRPSRP